MKQGWGQGWVDPSVCVCSTAFHCIYLRRGKAWRRSFWTFYTFFVVLRLSENIVEWGRCHQHFCFSLLLCNIYLGWRSCNVTEAFQITRVFTLNWDFYVFLNPQLALLCLSKTSHLTSLCPKGARNPPEAVWNLSNLTYLFFSPPGIDIVPIP